MHQDWLQAFAGANPALGNMDKIQSNNDMVVILQAGP
jgi:hypothetical protein